MASAEYNRGYAYGWRTGYGRAKAMCLSASRAQAAAPARPAVVQAIRPMIAPRSAMVQPVTAPVKPASVVAVPPPPPAVAQATQVAIAPSGSSPARFAAKADMLRVEYTKRGLLLKDQLQKLGKVYPHGDALKAAAVAAMESEGTLWSAISNSKSDDGILLASLAMFADFIPVIQKMGPSEFFSKLAGRPVVVPELRLVEYLFAAGYDKVKAVAAPSVVEQVAEQVSGLGATLMETVKEKPLVSAAVVGALGFGAYYFVKSR